MFHEDMGTLALHILQSGPVTRLQEDMGTLALHSLQSGSPSSAALQHMLSPYNTYTTNLFTFLMPIVIQSVFQIGCAYGEQSVQPG